MATTPTYPNVSVTKIVTALCGYKVIGVLEGGFDVIETLTSCCEAAHTGTVNGIACKGCGRIVADDEGAGGSRYELEKAAIKRGCPAPLECADHTLWALQRELGLLP